MSTSNPNCHRSSTLFPRRTPRCNHLRSAPPPAPLPPGDIKIVFRPRGGLDVNPHDPLTVVNHLQTQAFLLPHSQDQIRLHLRPNFVVITTPLEDRARQNAALYNIHINNQLYPLATHVAAPANSATGVVFGLPLNRNADDVFSDLIHSNPIFTSSMRFMGSSTLTKVTFNGSRVAYWIRYPMVTLRCAPLKHNTEACPRCWSVVHRADLCPSPAVDNRCNICGTLNTSSQHTYHPRSIMCAGPQPTGGPAYPQRY
ncbi:hypothetical protein HPB48_011896 [Haemaphysalis longicornis]|uniref:Uncharacterized protein n=1 Tax=Haemaphysalis longicornis TaxID=44386 RepID=A0A9J6FL16_HAELO|nr:hypothetical protein HPB48_011896 [Haemaphysalis longicornis]